MYKQLHTHTNGKFLGTPKVWINCAFSSHIYGGPHHEFNEQNPL